LDDDADDLEVLNFDDFKIFLNHYRKTNRIDNPNDKIYERAEIIPLKASSDFSGEYVIKLDKAISDGDDGDFIYYEKTSNSSAGNANKKVQALFYDEKDPFNDDVLWASMYWPNDGNYPEGDDWEGGWFLEDYVERSLPHIFSCVRRIPGFLGAPMALTSPYMILEPYDYLDPINGTVKRDEQFRAWRNNNSNSILAPLTETDKVDEMQKHIIRQPKVSVEDLVSRHALPKVCFLSNGIFAIQSVGQVKDEQNEIVAKTTINVLVQLFETKYFRYQNEFVNLLERNQDAINDIKYVTNTSSPGGQGIFEDIWLGPETKIKVGPGFDIADSSATYLRTKRDKGSSKVKGVGFM